MVELKERISIGDKAKHPLYYRYWGKARPTEDSQNQYHLLPYHCMDVAAVGNYLLAPGTYRCQYLAQQLRVDQTWLRDLFVFCLALHDLGKFARAFQGLQQELSADLVKANPRMRYDQRHDSLGYWLWINAISPDLSEGFPINGFDNKAVQNCLEQLEPWLEIVTGHHGIPPKKCCRRLEDYFQTDDKQAAVGFVQETVFPTPVGMNQGTIPLYQDRCRVSLKERVYHRV